MKDYNLQARLLDLTHREKVQPQVVAQHHLLLACCSSARRNDYIQVGGKETHAHSVQ
jgi:hypothetical protein